MEIASEQVPTAQDTSLSGSLTPPLSPSESQSRLSVVKETHMTFGKKIRTLAMMLGYLSKSRERTHRQLSDGSRSRKWKTGDEIQVLFLSPLSPSTHFSQKGQSLRLQVHRPPFRDWPHSLQPNSDFSTQTFCYFLPEINSGPGDSCL